MLRHLLRPVVRNVRQRGTRGYEKWQDEVANYKPATMDELPIPQGSWQQLYESRQRIYNMQLAAGLIYAVGTMTYIISTGAIYMNWAPPIPMDERK